jgi:hypothetical protein
MEPFSFENAKLITHANDFLLSKKAFKNTNAYFVDERGIFDSYTCIIRTLLGSSRVNSWFKVNEFF